MSIPVTNITVSILFREFIITFLSAFDFGSWQKSDLYQVAASLSSANRSPKTYTGRFLQVAASLSSANRSPKTYTGRFCIPNYVRDLRPRLTLFT